MKVDDIYAELKMSRTTIDKLNAPTKSGIYAIFLKEGVSIDLGKEKLEGLIYIGSTWNLSQREYDTHFKTGKSGSSTLRRSIAAILKEKLQLKAVPRGKGQSEKDYQNFCFESKAEGLLTDWMNDNLEIGICTVEGEYENVEKELIQYFSPALNLKGGKNPLSKIIKKLRRVCADEARESKQ